MNADVGTHKMRMTKGTRISMGTIGFFLPVLAILFEFLVQIILPDFKLPALLTPVIFLCPIVLFGLAIFTAEELKVPARLGLFAGAILLFAVQVVVLGITLVMFTLHFPDDSSHSGVRFVPDP